MRKVFKLTPIKVIALVVFLILVTITIVNNQGSTMQRSRRGGPPVTITVRSREVEAEDVTTYFKTSGRVKAINQADIMPDQTGRLQQYTVEVGTNVYAGQILGYVNPNTAGQGYMPSPIRSTISGIVISLPIEQGNSVTGATVVASVGDISQLKIESYIPDRYAFFLELGKKAVILDGENSEVIATAEVIQLSPVVDINSSTIKTVFKIIPKEGAPILKLLAGMYVDLEVESELYEQVYQVPSTAVLTRGTQQYVYAVDKDSRVVKAIAVNVLTSVNENSLVKGVELDLEGENIIIEGQTLVTQGEKVNDLTLPEAVTEERGPPSDAKQAPPSKAPPKRP